MLLNTVKEIQTKTFDQQLNFVPRIDQQFEAKTLRPLSMYQKMLGKEKEEKLSFKIVEVKKERPSTKGRFQSTLPSCAQQSIRDKQIAREMFPEIFEEKLVSKKKNRNFLSEKKSNQQG
eukprot:TRINITY_DN37840_c0_g1_i1.p2 TRINITY_DN37840_c0_g1~~TRINITY_DN37840_c0_g1_i1.p2  ORF type:complete len:119 (-),score=22.79 TRINITY_DN37840_c0_g1_i1:19-375(-)